MVKAVTPGVTTADDVVASAAADPRDLDLRLVRRKDGAEIDVSALQGLWSTEQSLRLTDQTNHLIEFTDGNFEVLPMPTDSHQATVAFLYELLVRLIRLRRGIVRFAPLRVQIPPNRFREPDLVVLLDAQDRRRQDAFWLGADLVVEVVSPDNPERDTVEQRADYASSGIPEYWVVNPLDETITVLALHGDAYATHGVFPRGAALTSPLLTGLTVSVDQVFDAQ